MFFDLNLVAANPRDVQSRRELLAAAIRLGYDGAASSHLVIGQLASQDVCQLAPFDLQDLLTAVPGVVQKIRCHQSLVKENGERTFKQISRLTVVASDISHVNALNSTNTVSQSYDLVAIQPANQKVFARACTHAEVDIISIDLSSRLQMRFHRPTLDAAIQRGIFFEISYSPALSDGGARRQLFANAQMLYSMTRGRNIIVSSGALEMAVLRGPYDVANLSTLFGCSVKAARDALSHNCLLLLSRSEERRAIFKSAIKVERFFPQSTSLEKNPSHLTTGAQTEAPSFFEVPGNWKNSSSKSRPPIHAGESVKFSGKPLEGREKVGGQALKTASVGIKTTRTEPRFATSVSASQAVRSVEKIVKGLPMNKSKDSRGFSVIKTIRGSTSVEERAGAKLRNVPLVGRKRDANDGLEKQELQQSHDDNFIPMDF